MKIAIIGTHVESSLNFRETLLKKLLKEGHDVYFFASDYTEKSFQYVQGLGVTPVKSPLNRASFNPLSDLIGTYKLIKILKATKPDVCFSFFSKPVIFGSLAAYFAKIPRIVGMLEGLGYFFTKRPQKDSLKIVFIRQILVFLYTLCFKVLNQLVLLNRDDEKDLIQTHRIKVHNIHILGGIGVDPHDFSYHEPIAEPVTFLFVGRLLHDKGVRELVEAARIVKKLSPSSRFLIVGDLDRDNPASLSCPQKEALENEGIIDFLGFQKDIRPFLKNCSVFVLPSYREGVPLSTQEAMMIGRPVITTDVPGCKDTVIDGENGFITPPFDAESVAQKMMFFVENPEKIKEMGEKSHNFAQKMFNRNDKDEQLKQLILGI